MTTTQTIYHWTLETAGTISSGDWGSAAAWDQDAVPGTAATPAADVVIGSAAAYTVTIEPSESFQIDSVTLADPNATLAVNGALTLGGSLATINVEAGTLSLGGTVSGGTIAVASGASVVAAGGTLSNVAFDGVLNVTTDDLFVENGTTFAGSGGTGQATIDLGDGQGFIFLTVLGSGSLDNATINANGGFDAGIYNDDMSGAGATLTFGPHLTIQGDVILSGSVDTGDGIVNDGTINANEGDGSFIDPASFTNNGTITVSNGDLLNFFVAAPTNNGAITVSDATVVFSAGVPINNGTITVSNDGTVDFNAAEPTGSGVIAFGAGGGTLEVDTAPTGANPPFYTFGNELVNFGAGDAIDFTNLAYQNGASAAIASQSGGTGRLGIFDVTAAELFSLPSAPNLMLSVTPDGDGGTLLTAEAPCYCRGTCILTDRGEVAVEDLQIGDRLVTRSGEARALKWIGRRSYDGRFASSNPNVLPVCFKAGALADRVPRRDLWVSPEHAMFLDDALVPAGLLVNGLSIVKAEAIEAVHYHHLELDSHDVILAEGAPSETFVDDGSRGMFQNADTFHALYPDAPPGPARFCAPRVEGGFELDALTRRLAERARRLRPDATAPDRVLRGFVDHIDRTRVGGWAFDPETPDARIAVVVFANGVEIGRVVADRYRRDLDQAGIGDGRHGFALEIPGGLSPELPHDITARGEDGWVLPAHCPPVLEQSVAAGPLGALRGALDSVDRLRIAGWAQDEAAPERPVGLVVTANGAVIAHVLANERRPDLAAASMGSGRHGFAVLIAGALAPGAVEVRVRRAADGADLPGSPRLLPAPRTLDDAAATEFSTLLGALADEQAEDRALALLTRETEALLARRAARRDGRAERAALALFRRRHGQDATPPAEAGLADSGPRALVIARLVPGARDDAGASALLSDIRALRALGHDVSIAAADDMGNAFGLAALAAAEGISECAAPRYGCVEDILRLHDGAFDLVALHGAEIADRYLGLARRYAPKARIVVRHAVPPRQAARPGTAHEVPPGTALGYPGVRHASAGAA